MRTSNLIGSLVLTSVCLHLTGCANLSTLSSLSLPKQEPAKLTSADGQCIVEFQGGRKPETQNIDVRPDTRVQTVLEQTKAYSKFRRLHVTVLRKSNKKPDQIVKLVASVDSKKNQVSWETDYAILPGDKIIIKRDDSTVLDRTLSSVFTGR